MKIILSEKEVAEVLARHCAVMVCNGSEPAEFHVSFPNVNSLQAEIVYGESPEDQEEHEHSSGDETKQPTQRRTRRTKAEMEAARAAEEAAKKQAEQSEKEPTQQQAAEEPAKEEEEEAPFDTSEQAPTEEVVEQPKEEPVEAAPQPARRSLFGGLSRPTNS